MATKIVLLHQQNACQHARALHLYTQWSFSLVEINSMMHNRGQEIAIQSLELLESPCIDKFRLTPHCVNKNDIDRLQGNDWRSDCNQSTKAYWGKFDPTSQTTSLCSPSFLQLVSQFGEVTWIVNVKNEVTPLRLMKGLCWTNFIAIFQRHIALLTQASDFIYVLKQQMRFNLSFKHMEVGFLLKKPWECQGKWVSRTFLSYVSKAPEDRAMQFHLGLVDNVLQVGTS